MATYNGCHYLQAQIDSILAQMEEGDQLLVSDDASDDTTYDLLTSYGKRLTVIAKTRIGGVVPNFERVLSAAHSDIIVLVDQDDVWLPGRIDCIRREIISADVLLLNAKIVDEELNDSGTTLFDTIGIREGFLTNIFKNGFVGCCMAFKKDILKIVLPFPYGLPWHDWYIGLIGELFYRVKRINEPYLLYRRHAQNCTVTGSKSKNSLVRRFSMRVWILYALVIASFRKFSISIKQAIF